MTHEEKITLVEKMYDELKALKNDANLSSLQALKEGNKITAKYDKLMGIEPEGPGSWN
jgi:hypothetical protein